MLHPVETRGRVNMRQWTPQLLVTHPTEPCLFLQRDSASAVKKMMVEKVVLWPHYVRYLIKDKHSSPAAARTVIIRGHLESPSEQDAEFLRAVRKAHRGAAAAAARTTEDPPAALQDGDDLPRHDADGGNEETDTDALSSGDEDVTALRRGSVSSSSAGGDGCQDDDEEPEPDAAFVPGAGGYPNPLLPTSQQQQQRRAYARRKSGSVVTTSRQGSKSMSRADQFRAIDDFLDNESYSGGDDSGSEEGSQDGGKARRSTGSKSSKGYLSFMKRRKMWILRCPTLDGLRSLVQAMQGVETGVPHDPSRPKPPVPLKAILGTFEEVQERLILKHK